MQLALSLAIFLDGRLFVTLYWDVLILYILNLMLWLVLALEVLDTIIEF